MNVTDVGHLTSDGDEGEDKMEKASKRENKSPYEIAKFYADIFFEDFSGHIMDDDTLARLISMPNVIVTSHQAFLTNEALENIAKTTTDNIVSFLENGSCENELCYRCGKTHTCRENRIQKCF